MTVGPVEPSGELEETVDQKTGKVKYLHFLGCFITGADITYVIQLAPFRSLATGKGVSPVIEIGLSQKSRYHRHQQQ